MPLPLLKVLTVWVGKALAVTSAPPSGCRPTASETTPRSRPRGPSEQVGKRNEPMRVCQPVPLLVSMYSAVSQKVQSSSGSTVRLL